MTYQEAKNARDVLDSDVGRLGAILRAYPKGPMNLTPDTIRATPEWKAVKAEFDSAFQRLRKFNAAFVRTFKKEIQAERRNRKPCNP